MKQSKNQSVLEDSLVKLRPLRKEDFELLYEAAKDPKIWEQHTDERYRKDVFTRFFDDSLKSGGALVIIYKASGDIIGTSRYNTLERADDAIEIGWTFLERKYWGGTYNTAVKTLMIDHAFSFYKDVIFYVDKENIRSQKAVEKMGGIQLSADSIFSQIRRDQRDLTYRIRKKDWQKKSTTNWD